MTINNARPPAHSGPHADRYRLVNCVLPHPVQPSSLTQSSLTQSRLGQSNLTHVDLIDVWIGSNLVVEECI